MSFSKTVSVLLIFSIYTVGGLTYSDCPADADVTAVHNFWDNIFNRPCNAGNLKKLFDFYEVLYNRTKALNTASSGKEKCSVHLHHSEARKVLSYQLAEYLTNGSTNKAEFAQIMQRTQAQPGLLASVIDQATWYTSSNMEQLERQFTELSDFEQSRWGLLTLYQHLTTAGSSNPAEQRLLSTIKAQLVEASKREIKSEALSRALLVFRPPPECPKIETTTMPTTTTTTRTTTTAIAPKIIVLPANQRMTQVRKSMISKNPKPCHMLPNHNNLFVCS